jgi:hypothetical protein
MLRQPAGRSRGASSTRAPAEPRDPQAFGRYPEEPVDAAKVGDVFGRFGSPERLD